MQVERSGLVVEGVDEDGPHADNSRQRAARSVRLLVEAVLNPAGRAGREQALVVADHEIV